jgi:hypothetical protein
MEGQWRDQREETVAAAAVSGYSGEIAGRDTATVRSSGLLRKRHGGGFDCGIIGVEGRLEQKSKRIRASCDAGTWLWLLC